MNSNILGREKPDFKVTKGFFLWQEGNWRLKWAWVPKTVQSSCVYVVGLCCTVDVHPCECTCHCVYFGQKQEADHFRKIPVKEIQKKDSTTEYFSPRPSQPAWQNFFTRGNLKSKCISHFLPDILSLEQTNKKKTNNKKNVVSNNLKMDWKSTVEKWEPSLSLWKQCTQRYSGEKMVRTKMRRLIFPVKQSAADSNAVIWTGIIGTSVEVQMSPSHRKMFIFMSTC